MNFIPPQDETRLRAAASGVLPNGKPVVVNADGTVSVAAAVAAASGTVVNFTSNNAEETDIAYIGSSKIVIAYKDDSASNVGTAVVGTISGTSLSFGTPVVFNNADTRNHVKLDSIGSDKVVIVFQDVGDSNHGTAIVGTVSGTSISFGSEADFEGSDSTIWPNVASIGDNKVVIAWCKDAGGSANGIAVVGTVSGTSISFGTEVVFDAVGKYNAVASIGDSKVVIAYRDDGDSDKGKAIVGTVSGTSISFGTAVVYNDAGTANVDVGSIGSSKVVIAYSDTGNSNYGTAIVGTVSGTSISYGSEVVFESVSITQPTVSSIGNDRVQITYRDSATEGGQATTITGAVSGTAIAFSDLTTFGNNKNFVAAAAVGDNQIVVAYKQAGNSDALFRQIGSTNITAENYVGMSGGVVAFTGTALGSAVLFEDAVISQISKIAFDSNSNRVVIGYRDEGNSDYGTAVVGSVSPANNSITFGTPVVFEAGKVTNVSVVFDSSNNKVVIVYAGPGDAMHGRAIVGTVDPSDNSISFGTAAVFEASSVGSFSPGATFDSNSNKVVIVYSPQGNSLYGTAKVATVSGTSISFGTAAVFSSTSSDFVNATFDNNSNKTVIIFRNGGNSLYGTAVVGTVSGTDISYGSLSVFNAGSTTYNACTFDSDLNKVLVAFRDAGNSNKGTAVIGTVSGTSISFGSEVVFNDAVTTEMSATYDTLANKVVISYEEGGANTGNIISGAISGTSITFDTAVVYDNAEVNDQGCVFDSNSNRVVVAYEDDANTDKGTGIVFKTGFTNRGQVASGSSASVDIIGTVSTNQDGLTAGQSYFVQTDGTLGLTAGSPSVFAGTAISATKLLVKA